MQPYTPANAARVYIPLSYGHLNMICCLSGYIFLVGMLMSQFAISGYDACAHMSEVGVSARRCSVQGLVRVYDWTHSTCWMNMHGCVLRT